MSELFMTTDSVGRELGVSSQRVRDLEREGRLLPDARTTRGWRLYALASVEKLKVVREEKRNKGNHQISIKK